MYYAQFYNLNYKTKFSDLLRYKSINAFIFFRGTKSSHHTHHQNANIFPLLSIEFFLSTPLLNMGNLSSVVRVCFYWTLSFSPCLKKYHIWMRSLGIWLYFLTYLTLHRNSLFPSLLQQNARFYLYFYSCLQCFTVFIM